MDRFWKKVVKTEYCWEWTSWKTNGYGRFHYKGKKIRAHRMAWFLTYGDWVDSDTHVLHKCDNPLCVNPDHLFLGTNDDNIADKIQKGRSGFKLTVENVIEIKQLLKSGEKQSVIAKKFGLSSKHVWRIATGENWSHVKC